MSPPRAAQKRTRRSPAEGLSQRILTPNEVADRLLIAPVTVRLWASRGLLPSISTPGGHRRFRVEDVDAFIAKRQQIQGAAPSPPSRLLIIDDDAQFARYLSNLLAARAPQLAVDVALDGFSAGIKCESMRPDVVTLDLHMPDMDGIAVCRLLRSMFGEAKPRIVALSGFLTSENARLVLEAGANVCLPKTTAAEQLIRELGVVTVASSGAGP
jgi:excisionase family DNA binding protein